MSHMKYQKVAILGFGVTGQSAARYFSALDVPTVHVFDQKSATQFDAALIQEFKNSNVVLHFEHETVPDITLYDMLMVSSGVPITHPSIQAAFVARIPVFNDITYFLKEWRKIGPIVGVTGSNGKSTTVSLLHHVLNGLGKPNLLVGNIGNSPLAELRRDHVAGTIVIIELSSYQLELFSAEDYADIAVITNLTENHLDRYEGKMELYAQAKLRIAHPDKSDVIITADDRGTQQYIIPRLNPAKIIAVSLEQLSREATLCADPTQRHLKGEHNLYNIAIVIEVLRKLNIEITDTVLSLIREYRGLEHRIEFVRTHRGVTYVNDSKSTSVDAMRVALEAFGTQKNIILLAGGSDKGGSYSPVADYFNQYVKHIILLEGYESTLERIKKVADAHDVETSRATNFDDVMQRVRTIATDGDVVLLSPGGGHVLHMKNFEEVGRAFKNAVNGL